MGKINDLLGFKFIGWVNSFFGVLAWIALVFLINNAIKYFFPNINQTEFLVNAKNAWLVVGLILILYKNKSWRNKNGVIHFILSLFVLGGISGIGSAVFEASSGAYLALIITGLYLIVLYNPKYDPKTDDVNLPKVFYNKFLYIIILCIAVVGFLFYWFQIKPSNVISQCNKDALDYATKHDDENSYKDYYQICLRDNGINK